MIKPLSSKESRAVFNAFSAIEEGNNGRYARYLLKIYRLRGENNVSLSEIKRAIKQKEICAEPIEELLSMEPEEIKAYAA